MVGWSVGLTDAISPKAINQSGSAVESVQIGLIKVATGNMMAEVQEILLVISLSSQQLRHYSQ